MGYLEAIEEMISLVKNTQLSPVFNIYILKFVIVNDKHCSTIRLRNCFI